MVQTLTIMNAFPIQFSYEKKSYKAMVNKVTDNALEYHVLDIENNDFNLPMPFVISKNKSSKTFLFQTPGPMFLGFIIAESIVKACKERKIPVYN